MLVDYFSRGILKWRSILMRMKCSQVKISAKKLLSDCEKPLSDCANKLEAKVKKRTSKKYQQLGAILF